MQSYQLSTTKGLSFWKKIRPYVSLVDKTFVLRPEMERVNSRMITCPSRRPRDTLDEYFEEGEGEELVARNSLLISQMAAMKKSEDVKAIRKRTGTLSEDELKAMLKARRHSMLNPFCVSAAKRKSAFDK